MKTKNRISLIIILLFFILNAHAQRIGYTEITEKRIEFIAPRLSLTAQEAQQFWPLFREFHAEREKISKKIKIKNNQLENKQPSTEEEYINAINFMIDSKLDQTALMKEYNKRYLEVLPAKKVYRLYQIDEDFNKFLLNQLKESDQGRKK